MLQEIDVVKGPSSVLYGRNPARRPGQPGHQAAALEQLREVVLNYGSYDRMQAQADFGGPVGDDGVGLPSHRAVAQQRHPGRLCTGRPLVVAPVLTWTPPDRTTWTLLGDFQHDETGWSQFLPSQGTLTSNPHHGDIDRSLFRRRAGLRLLRSRPVVRRQPFEFRIDDDKWALRNTLRYSSIEFDGKTVFGGGLQNDLRTLNRFGFGNTLDLKIFTMDTNAYAASTPAASSTRCSSASTTRPPNRRSSAASPAAALDVFHPVYGRERPGPLHLR